MNGVGQLEGAKTVTEAMISQQQHRADLEASRLSDMINLAGTSTEDTLISGEPASALESTSPQTPDFVRLRSASNTGLRILFDDRVLTSEEIAGSSPAKNPSENLTPSNDTPPQGRSGLPWSARLLAWLGIERGWVGDGCPVCGRRG